MVPVTLYFVGGRAVAALFGLSGFFISSVLVAAALPMGFFVLGVVVVVDFVAGALVAAEGLDAGALVTGALTSFLDVPLEGFVAPGCFFAAANPVDGAALEGDLADLAPTDWDLVFVILSVFLSVGKAWVSAGLAVFSTGLTSFSEGFVSSSGVWVSSVSGSYSHSMFFMRQTTTVVADGEVQTVTTRNEEFTFEQFEGES